MDHLFPFDVLMKRCLQVLVLFALLGAPGAVFADTVRLTNGRAIEGIIIEETAAQVVLDMGAGNITIRRDRITGIEHSKESEQGAIREEWRKKYFLHRKNVPEGLETVAQGFLTISDMRGAATQARLAVARSEATNRKLQAESDALRDELVKVSRKLQTVSPKDDVQGYNAVVLENNTVQAKLVVKRDEIARAEKTTAGYMQKISDYTDSLSSYEARFQGILEEHRRSVTNDEKRVFAERIDGCLKGYDGEFISVSVPADKTPGGNTLVSVSVNGTPGRFILDTGAALMTITDTFARRIKIDTSGRPTMEVVVADGSKVPATSITLTSVQVGDARARDVAGVVLSGSIGTGIDGLLGMTFLKDFSVHLDGSTGKLTLRQFSPK